MWEGRIVSHPLKNGNVLVQFYSPPVGEGGCNECRVDALRYTWEVGAPLSPSPPPTFFFSFQGNQQGASDANGLTLSP